MRRAVLRNTLTKGVIDRALSERIDLQHYYDGLHDGVNVECLPQGGARRRAGTEMMSDYYYASRGYKKRLRFEIYPIQATTGMVTAHNGGVASRLVDQDPSTVFTTSAVGGSPFVVAEFDFGTAREVTFVDVIGFSCAVGRHEDAIGVEYWDGSAWRLIRNGSVPGVSYRKGLRTTERTRRFGNWPGGDRGNVISARSWRIVAVGAQGAGAISVRGVRFWGESNRVSPVRGFTFARASDLVYELVLTARNIDVFRDRKYVASVPVPVAAHQVEEVTVEQSLDTMFIFHEDIETQSVQRQASNDEWNLSGSPFTDVPALSPGTAFAGDQDEIQEVWFEGLSAGDVVAFYLGEAVTAPITYSDADALVVSLKAALEALPGVASGLVVETLDAPRTGCRVRFRGSNGARAWPALSAVLVSSARGRALRATVQRGLLSTGPIMGATTGWPRCGAVVQGRVLLAGFRAAPQTLAATRVGNFSMLSTGDPLTADLGFVRTLDTDTLETINQIFVGQHVQIFTDSGEWYVESRTFDATQPSNFVLATRYGMKRTVRATFADGATIFVQKGGRVLRDLIFSDAELSYRANPLSLLAPHLLTDVVDVGHRPARSTSEGNQLYMVNRDGTMAFASLLREQEVVALTPWLTDGKVRSVFSDLLLRTWLVVERDSENGPALYLEKLDDTQTLDGAVTYDRGGMTTKEVAGLEAHEGREVWGWADGDLIGPMVVSGGKVTLPQRFSRVTVGRAPAWYLELPKLLPQLPEGYPFRPPARIYAVDLALAGTGHVEISVNGGKWVEVNLDSVNLTDIGEPLPRDVTGLSESSATDRLEFMTRALCMIPSAGEHVYATELVTRDLIGTQVEVNSFDGESTPTFLASLGQANQAFPRLKNVSLFVTWFGTDLRCGNCTIRPKTDQPSKVTSQAWTVAGVGRQTAQSVTQNAGKAAYGGTPGDISVVQAIKAIADHGQQVTFTPFILMDIPAGNALPNPYGGASQAAYPWRGRITCTPAPGQPGTVDLTATAAAQVQAFMGTAAVSDFSVAGEAVTYTGPAGDWGYRRFILHYAHLCKAAGGVDAFVIGSEMRGLSWVRSALGVYPFVDALKVLAADVRSVLGAEAKIVYAADWSEFVAHQTGVPGELFFHLDPLWSDANIDAIGIDNYWPLSDWRDGTAHADFAAGFRSIEDRGYLQSNIWGGEGYDWYYASQADRDNQVRTPITDGAYGEPWVWRYKDLRGWWKNAHHNRPAGVRDAAATAWVPESKPIWFLEAGCPAVDKGANQPNVFYDPKSSESFFPYYSAGVRDDGVQRAYIEAMLSFFDENQGSFDDAVNPSSSIYNGRMVDVERVYVYTWDARYFPAFPDLLDVYADGAQWEYGHWLTGRVYIPVPGSEDAIPVGNSLELPLLQRLTTGVIRLTGLRGFSRHPTIRLRQSRPAPLELRAIRYEVSHRG